MSMIRTRWAAIGAAIAVTLGAGGGFGLAQATKSTGERPVFVSITPCRVTDTRPGQAIGGRTAPIGPAEALLVDTRPASGPCAGQVPSDAVSVGINITAVQATASTFLTVYPDGAAVPGTSTLNPEPSNARTVNGATTGISGGKFRIRNEFGSVHTIVDINGYYVDHNHDDRYDRFISLPVESAVINNGASYQLNGGGDLSGMMFPNSGFPRFTTGWSLPPTYVPGTDIVVKITWGNSRHNATSCGVTLRANGVSAFRPNARPIYGNGVFTGDTNFDGSEVYLAMPSTGEQVRQTTMTIAGQPTPGINRYLPGDNMTMRLARDDGDTADTCTGKLFILGLTAQF